MIRGHDLGERGTVDVSRHQPWHRTVGIGVHDRRGENAADPAGGGYLLCEPGPEVSGIGELGPDDLDSDEPAAG
jgi:hypothetical protein